MVFKYLDNYKFTAFSHRGGSIEHHENTMNAFEKSINLGYEYIETDVRHTKDNKLVIFHDDDLRRICNLNIKISEIDFEELKKIKIFENHSIPLLDDAIHQWPDTNFNIDPKSDKASYLLLDELKKQKDLDRFCVGSFNSERLKIVRDGFNNNICTSMSQEEVIKLFFYKIFSLRESDIPCLQIPMYFHGVKIVTQKLVDHVHNTNKKIHIWTIDNEAEMQELIDLGVDGIMTDRPRKLKEILVNNLLWPA